MFEMIKDTLKRQYKNWAMDSPHQHAIYFGTLILQETLWHNNDKLKELEAITFENVTAFIPLLIQYLHIEALVHGNVGHIVHILASILSY